MSILFVSHRAGDTQALLAVHKHDYIAHLDENVYFLAIP